MFAAALGAIALTWTFAQRQDQAFVEESQRLVDGAVRGRVRALSNSTKDFAFWNDAYTAIAVAWDETWVEENYYSSATDGLLVFGADRRIRHAWFAEDIAPGVQGAATELAAAAGSDAELRAALEAITVDEATLTSFAVVDGALALLSTAPVSPEADEARRAARAAGAPASFAVSVDILDAAELAEMGAALDLQNIAFLPAAAGEPGACIVWRNETPGSAAFLDQLWPLLLGLLLLGGAATFIAARLVSHQVQATARADAETEASRSKSELVAVLSHELRAPLSAIAVQTRQSRDFRNADDELRTLRAEREHTAKTARWILNLLDKLIEETQIDAGHLQPAVERVDVQRIIQGALEVVEKTAKARGVHVSVFADADVGEALADRLRLTQCIVNMMWSALRLTKTGPIELHAMRRPFAGKDFVAFDITVVGAALAGDSIARFFTHSAVKAAGQANANAGLSLTRKLARAMGGDAVAANDPARGAVLSLFAPPASEGRLREVA